MILAVDAGNTRVKASLAGPSRVAGLFEIPTSPESALARRFRDALDRVLDRLAGIEGSVICSVVPGLDRSLSSAIRGAAAVPVHILGHDSILPYRIRVRRPAAVGGDRLAAAAGAIGGGRAHAIVVDVGTAITVDLVVYRVFRGGLIMTGPGLAVEALGTHARRLPRVTPEVLRGPEPRRFDDTKPAMLLGARVAAAGAVLEGVRAVRRASRVHPDVFVTGGGAGLIDQRLPGAWRRDPQLVSRGLVRVWELNAAGGKKNP